MPKFAVSVSSEEAELVKIEETIVHGVDAHLVLRDTKHLVCGR